MLKIGDTLYHKKFKTAPEDGLAEGILHKGHLLSLLLGYVKEGSPSPSYREIQALLGAAGYAKFDDVLEALGSDCCNILLEYVKKKYQGNAKA